MKRVSAGNPDGGQFAEQIRTEAEGHLPSEATHLAGEPIPIRPIEHLHHVGTLDATRKADWSLEGQGLSVSQHPNAWQGIAALGGEGSLTWKFDGLDENQFLDYHELTDAQKEAITLFGVERGYIEETTAFKITSIDCETDEPRWFLEPTLERAEYEADEDSEITEIPAFRATAAFPDPTVKAGDLDADQILATVWVNEVATHLDGVWWQDDFDPQSYSAPRGVIAANRIAAWVDAAVPAPGAADLFGDESDDDDDD